MFDWTNPSGGSWHKEPETRTAPVRKTREKEAELTREIKRAELPPEPVVKVQRTIFKEVPESEALVLLRHGWVLTPSD